MFYTCLSWVYIDVSQMEGIMNGKCKRSFSRQAASPTSYVQNHPALK